MTSTLIGMHAHPRVGVTENKSVATLKQTTKSTTSEPKRPSQHLVRLSKRRGPAVQEVMSLCNKHHSLCTLVEYKEPPTYQGKDAPTRLMPQRDFSVVPSESSKLFSGVLMDMFKQRQYEFILSNALTMSSSGTGIVNSVISIQNLASNSEFAALSGVFNEFFVKSMRAVWMPVGRYNGPLGYTFAGTLVSSLPIGIANLQHAASAYTSLGNMTENWQFAYTTTSDPFEYTWHNVESPSSTVLPSTGAATQAWCPVSNAANYTGAVQFLSNSAPPALPTSVVLGTFCVSFDVLFRIRE